jgi:hypothetical protein
LYLESDEKGHGLDGVVASVDVVAHEEVIRVRRFAADPEKHRTAYNIRFKNITLSPNWQTLA